MHTHHITSHALHHSAHAAAAATRTHYCIERRTHYCIERRMPAAADVCRSHVLIFHCMRLCYWKHFDVYIIIFTQVFESNHSSGGTRSALRRREQKMRSTHTLHTYPTCDICTWNVFSWPYIVVNVITSILTYRSLLSHQYSYHTVQAPVHYCWLDKWGVLSSKQRTWCSD